MKLTVYARGDMDLLEQRGHGQPGLVIGKPLEPVEDLPSDDFFTSARNQPVVEEDRRTGGTEADQH